MTLRQCGSQQPTVHPQTDEKLFQAVMMLTVLSASGSPTLPLLLRLGSLQIWQILTRLLLVTK